MPIEEIQSSLEPLRYELLHHPVYQEIQNPEHLHVFMQHHVFAVWDFMSLLKTMQRTICGVSIPWTPPVDPLAARMINEIVLGEESDEDGEGGYASHFELYHRAMSRCGANTAAIDSFIDRLTHGMSVEDALDVSHLPNSVRRFVSNTFRVIDSADICAVTAAFTFGREDLLPDVFQRIVDELNAESGGELDGFRYYLQRHIELDGDQHGAMATRLLSNLCGDDERKWARAKESAVKSLEYRLVMWDGILEAITESHAISVHN